MTLFYGDRDRQVEFVAMIDAAIDEGRLLSSDDNRLAETISVLGVLLDANDVDRFEAETGMPATFALMLEEIVRSSAGRYRTLTRSLVRRWFAEPLAGTDLRPCAATIAIAILDELSSSVAPDADLAEVIGSLQALHRAQRDHDTVPARSAWAALRTQALSLTDAAEPGAERQIAEITSGLAWPLDRSRTVLPETLRAFCGLVAWQAAAADGWTLADREAAHIAMQQLWDDTAAERESDPAGYRFPAVFARDRPDIEPGFVRALNTENSTYVATSLQLANRCIAIFANADAPIPSQLIDEGDAYVVR